MNEQENTKVAEQLYETFNSGDVEGFLNLFSEDANWNTPDIENIKHLAMWATNISSV